MTYRKKVPAWDKEKRKKGFDTCRCGAVMKYCICTKHIIKEKK